MKLFAIDVHSHVECPRTMDIVKKRYSEEEIFSRFVLPTMGPRSAKVNRGLMPGLREPLRSPQRKIEDMDKAGIALSVLSSTPFSFFYEVEDDLAIELAQYQNDCLSEMVKNNPDRFFAMATLPLQTPSAALKELKRAREKLGLRGIEIGSHVGKRELGDRAFWPIYEALAEQNGPIFIHPHHVAGMDRLQDFYLSNLIGNPLDTTIAAANLIFSGALERYPNLKIILAHAGGQFPYIFGRIDHGYRVRPECQDNIKKSPRQFLNQFCFDTIAHSPEALRYVISLAGSDHVVLGSDYPYDMGDVSPPKTVAELPGIKEKDRRKILRENAVILYGLKTS